MNDSNFLYKLIFLFALSTPVVSLAESSRVFFIDPVGDAFSGGDNQGVNKKDLGAFESRIAGDNLRLTLFLVGENAIAPSQGRNGNHVEGTIDIDVDQNRETGLNPGPGDIFRSLASQETTGLGTEISIDLGSEGIQPGKVAASSLGREGTLLDISYESTRVSLLVPLEFLREAGADSSVDVALIIGDGEGVTDVSPAAPWTLPLTSTNPIEQGDYNGDSVVDAADYTVWRDSLGSSLSPLDSPDGDGDGQVTANDYLVWRDNYGVVFQESSLAHLQLVPEPFSLGLLISAGMPLLLRRFTSIPEN